MAVESTTPSQEVVGLRDAPDGKEEDGDEVALSFSLRVHALIDHDAATNPQTSSRSSSTSCCMSTTVGT